MRDTPSGIPNPDGTERIRQVANDYGQTQAEAAAAFARLNDFLVYGKVPPSLEHKPESPPPQESAAQK
jgi:hypothetical protein